MNYQNFPFPLLLRPEFAYSLFDVTGKWNFHHINLPSSLPHASHAHHSTICTSSTKLLVVLSWQHTILFVYEFHHPKASLRRSCRCFSLKFYYSSRSVAEDADITACCHHSTYPCSVSMQTSIKSLLPVCLPSRSLSLSLASCSHFPLDDDDDSR